MSNRIDTNQYCYYCAVYGHCTAHCGYYELHLEGIKSKINSAL